MELDASVMLQTAIEKHSIDLGVLVAETALWASPEVHSWLVNDNGTGAFFPHVRRYRVGLNEKKNQIVGAIRLDDNSYANHAIKRALGFDRGYAVGFEVCHIWPSTCYDERFHTVVANLVLLPRPLAGLSDHDPHIQSVLQFRSYSLYGWLPEGFPMPMEPDRFPNDWRAPEPFNSTVLGFLRNRRSTVR